MTDTPASRYIVSTDKALLDVDTIHGFLTNCHWARGISRQLVVRSIEHSLCFGVYEILPSGARKQAGFARVISDYTTFAYLSDVFILEEYRGQDLAIVLLEKIMNHPDLQGLRRWLLVTTYAHGLYEKFGFSAPAHPEKFMEIFIPNLYEKEATLTALIKGEKVEQLK
ncbi:MAG: GNAT family N-acetyltransferase [[Chlorobium] sp. 445]|nr:MAG: GNAT family N-acetyltransferase [[Chlorobium] sp. 445]